ncbi:MBL fold metallo-hydrolase [Lampropedia puyangensis]|uniref:MBL fold metallo-hydrolase n=1 Tax=Lampropedia puyangensis TaxID=1330072 RepID=A0A4S8EZC6_9BURK|nr:MBL fold metallo-hydrolase [Lampropedia puyangensis]THT99670.1 MBL fold metallo-hydrolase [Lampropedia puyangensis]
MQANLTVFERGWLSSNCVLLQGRYGNALVDTGYATHAQQTVDLVAHALAGAPLQHVINTHLHSDHCGGNAALQQHWATLQTWVPNGCLPLVQAWDEDKLSFHATGQQCPRFEATGALRIGDVRPLGDAHWQVHGAAGHDPDMVILFEPQSATLISADALWENGFGVIFPEIEGIEAFDVMAKTLDTIEQLKPRHIIPGHGKPFDDTAAALKAARSRLEQFANHPVKHAHYAAKVLVKFKLLEWQHISRQALHQWGLVTPYLERLRHLMGQSTMPMTDWLDQLTLQLVASGAASISADGHIANQ